MSSAAVVTGALRVNSKSTGLNLRQLHSQVFDKKNFAGKICGIVQYLYITDFVTEQKITLPSCQGQAEFTYVASLETFFGWWTFG